MPFFQDHIQQKINHGFAKAASKLGTPFMQYRPQDNTTVIVEDNIVGELYVAYDKSANFNFLQPLDYNVASYYVLMDLTNVQIGDYLWNYDDRIFFVANIEPLKPAQVILCNIPSLSIYRPSGSTTNGYGGNTNPQLLLSGWPACMVPGTKGESNEAKTPGSVRAFWNNLMLPSTQVAIEPYDLVIDDTERRFIVSNNQKSQMGYFCTCSYQGA